MKTRFTRLVAALLPTAAVLVAYPVYAAQNGGVECEAVAGVNRYITIGEPIDEVLTYLEKNSYHCDVLSLYNDQVISCNISFSHPFELLLTVEDGEVTAIDTVVKSYAVKEITAVDSGALRSDNPLMNGQTPDCQLVNSMPGNNAGVPFNY
jgi:hypothetical protein